MKCQECTKRHLHCHSTCEDYLQWKRELDERNAKIREIKEKESINRNYDIDTAIKNKKRKGKR